MAQVSKKKGGVLPFLEVAAADFTVTALWTFAVCTFAVHAPMVAEMLGTPEYATLLGMLVTGLVLMGTVARALGGEFNPSNTISAAIAGGKEKTSKLVARIPAQAVGALVGAQLLVLTSPPHWKVYAKPPRLQSGVHIAVGALVEFALSFAINIVILLTAPVGGLVAQVLPLVATVLLIVLGSSFTGPGMNPAVAFGYAFHHGLHDELEHLLVYWLAPAVGAIVAGVFFRLISTDKKKPKAKTI